MCRSQNHDDCHAELSSLQVNHNVACKQVTELRGKAYEKLREFIHDIEENALRDRVVTHENSRKGGFLVPVNSFVFFGDVMEPVEATKGGGLQWVLKNSPDGRDEKQKRADAEEGARKADAEGAHKEESDKKYGALEVVRSRPVFPVKRLGHHLPNIPE